MNNFKYLLSRCTFLYAIMTSFPKTRVCRKEKIVFTVVRRIIFFHVIFSIYYISIIIILERFFFFLRKIPSSSSNTHLLQFEFFALIATITKYYQLLRNYSVMFLLSREVGRLRRDFNY